VIHAFDKSDKPAITPQKRGEGLEEAGDPATCCFTLGTMSSNKPNPLPLGDVLRDLAVLRASDVDLSDGAPFPDAESSDSVNEADGTQKSVQQSYQFVREAREALRVHQRGDLDKQGDKLDALRGQLEELRGGARGDNTKRSVF